jgi:glycolate oxidase FAD binding subunit
VTAPFTGEVSNRADEIASLLSREFGATNILTTGVKLAEYEVDGMRPAAVVQPTSPTEISDLLRFASAKKLAVIPSCGRTKLGIGMPPARYDVALDLSRMNRVLAYEARDLTLGVEPGMLFSSLAMTLAAEKQFLPLNPPFLQRATIGGILASDSASPLRHAYGGPRDFVLGLEFVTGDGTIAKSGGRVVKNVSGYDLHKLLIGSLGTLGVITRANFKTFPVPPAQAVFVAEFDGITGAMEFCRAFSQSPLGAMQVDVISPEAAKLLKAGAETEIAISDKHWCVVISAPGNEKVVERHRRELPTLAQLAKANEFAALGDNLDSMRVAAALLGSIREFPSVVLASNAKAVIFRIAALPSAMEAVAQGVAGVASEHAIPAAVVMRPYGLIYFTLLPTADDSNDPAQIAQTSRAVFRAAEELGANARIEFAPVELRRAVNVWGAPRPDFELMRRVKKVFDPANVLSPGRFAGET